MRLIIAIKLVGDNTNILPSPPALVIAADTGPALKALRRMSGKHGPPKGGNALIIKALTEKTSSNPACRSLPQKKELPHILIPK